MSNRDERENCKHHDSGMIYCVYCGATQDLLEVDNTDWKRYILIFSKDLSKLFINEPPSLELLFMLYEKNTVIVNQIPDEMMTYDIDINYLYILNNLKKLYVISIDHDLVSLTWYGKILMKKLRSKY